MIMRCHECGREFGEFDTFIPVYQMRLHGEGVEKRGYAHLWHFKADDDRD